MSSQSTPKSSSAPKPLSNREKRRFKQIAHHLQPVVMVGDNGLTENVLAETERALGDHELIKVKLGAGDKEGRDELLAALLAHTSAMAVTQIGKMVVLYRHNPKAKPHLSNIQRFGKST